MAKRNSTPEATRAMIRHAAAALFQEAGVHATSLFDIAKAANLSKGTLYYHYATKESLVLDIAEEHFSSMTARMFEWIDNLQPDTTAYQALAPLTDTLYKDKDSMRLHFALLCEAMREDGALRARIYAKHREWSVMLEVGALKMKGQGAQRFRRLGKTYIAVLNGYALHTLLDEDMDITFLLQILSDE